MCPFRFQSSWVQTELMASSWLGWWLAPLAQSQEVLGLILDSGAPEGFPSAALRRALGLYWKLWIAPWSVCVCVFFVTPQWPRPGLITGCPQETLSQIRKQEKGEWMDDLRAAWGSVHNKTIKARQQSGFFLADPHKQAGDPASAPFCFCPLAWASPLL